MIVVHAQTKHRSYPTFGNLLGAVLEYFARLASEEQEQPQAQGKPKEA